MKYVPEFNCFIRRVRSLTKDFPELYITSNDYSRVNMALITPANGGKLTFAGMIWNTMPRRGTFGITKIRRTVKGKTSLINESWYDEAVDLPDYWGVGIE